MNSILRTFRAGLLPFVLAGCASLRTQPSTGAPSAAITRGALRTMVDSLADSPDFRNANWGILIVDPEAGDTLYARNAGKLFMPASNMKIMTSATALAQLGPDFRYRTAFVARGPMRDGTLDGDLAIVGRGDPSVSDHMRGDAMRPLREVADSLVGRGLRRVRGRVVPAGDAFPGPVLGFGWSVDELDAPYAAGVDELLFNEGFSTLIVHAGAAAGDPVRVETRPARTDPPVRVLATTVAPAAATDSAPAGRRGRRNPATDVSVERDTATWGALVLGHVAAGDSAVLEITHHDPDAAYAAAMREALAERGVTIDGTAAPTATAAGDTLYTMLSPTLREILPPLLKPSQNQIAEALLRTIGLERAGAGTADSGRRVVERQIAAWGALPGGSIIRDGSGLSRYDYLTPETIVHVLDAMRRSPHFQIYHDALPIAGVDGTIASRMRGTPAERNVHAKTGTVSQARSLSGYMTMADGRKLIFSFLCNNFTVPNRNVERVQDAILARLAGSRLQ